MEEKVSAPLELIAGWTSFGSSDFKHVFGSSGSYLHNIQEEFITIPLWG